MNHIVIAALPRLESKLRAAKRPGNVFLPSSAIAHQIGFAQTLWKFRYFFNALTQLLSEDHDLASARGIFLTAVIVGPYFNADFTSLMEVELRRALPRSTSNSPAMASKRAASALR